MLRKIGLVKKGDMVNIGESSVSIFAVFTSKITQKGEKTIALAILIRDNPLKPPNNLGGPQVRTGGFGC